MDSHLSWRSAGTPSPGVSLVCGEQVTARVHVIPVQGTKLTAVTQLYLD